jgi:hypothetical protein
VEPQLSTPALLDKMISIVVSANMNAFECLLGLVFGLTDYDIAKLLWKKFLK